MQKIPDTNQEFVDIDSEIVYFQKSEFYQFVPEENQFMLAAKNAAIQHSLTSVFPIGIVAEKNGRILLSAGNGNGYHEANLETLGHKKGCVRRFLSDEREKLGLPKFKSGEGFELCPGCHTDSHAEANLVKKSAENGIHKELAGADIYMYGHFWCCKPCWEKMLGAKIKNVYLPDTYEKFKDKETVALWAKEVLETKNIKI